jgi:hypothetical protein
MTIQRATPPFRQFVSLLIGWTKSLASDRSGDEPLACRTSEGPEQEQE